MTDPNWLIFFGGLFCIFLELVIGVDTGFDLLLIGLSLILGSIGGFLTQSYITAIAISSLMSVLYILFGRRLVKDKLLLTTHKMNIDALIGKEALVTERIPKNNAGKVKLENEVWRAISDRNIETNTVVKILSVEGVTLKVA